jgi:hypothetical protein
MPKFMTYQRPAPISKQNWNAASDRKATAPRKAPEATRPAPAIVLPALGQLIRKD